MPVSIAVRLSASVSFLLLIGSTVVAAQVPSRASEPRLSPREPVAPSPGQPTIAPIAPAQPEASPAPDAAPAAPAPVSAAPAPTGVTTLPAAPAPTSSSSQAATASSRGYVTAGYGLTLNGVPVASPRRVEGGGLTGVVVTMTPGSGQTPRKHIGSVRFEDIVVTTGLESKGLNDWIAASWKGNGPRQSGSFQVVDYNKVVRSEREFRDGLISETTMPTLSGESKSAAHVIVRIAPEETVLKRASGSSLSSGAKVASKWLSSNFRFELDGLDGSKVVKIDSFTVRQTVAADDAGEFRVSTKQPGAVEFPNLRITLRSGAEQGWQDWHEDFVVKGNNGENQERNGAIVYLDQTMRGELGRVSLSNCGIFRLAPENGPQGREQVQQFVAELYCEAMEFSAKGS